MAFGVYILVVSSLHAHRMDSTELAKEKELLKSRGREKGKKVYVLLSVRFFAWKLPPCRAN